MGRVEINFMDVGQGDCTFIQVFENVDDKAASHTMLVDFGSKKSGQVAGIDAITYINSRLVKMGSPKIDLIVLTHADEDHTNLIKPFLASDHPADLALGETVFGGEKKEYTKNGFNPITALEDAGGSASAFEDDYSNITSSEPAPKWTLGDLKIWIAQVNWPTKKNTAGADANTRCAIVLLDSYGVKTVLPGDATAQSMEKLATRVESVRAGAFFQGRKHWSAVRIPHHGSERTAIFQDGDTKDWDPTDNFISLINPGSAFVGADTHRTFKHPVSTVVDRYKANVTYGHTAHTNVVYVDADKKWVQRETKKNAYTSLKYYAVHRDLVVSAGVQYQYKIVYRSGIVTVSILATV